MENLESLEEREGSEQSQTEVRMAIPLVLWLCLVLRKIPKIAHHIESYDTYIEY